MSATQLSLKKLRREGWLVAVVEKWNPFVRMRQDLFGFADLLAVRGNECLLVQTTTAPNAAARVTKIRGNKSAKVWTSSPSRRITVHAWAKRGDKGKRKAWFCREIEITDDDLT